MKGLLARVAAHMRLERVAAGMGHAHARAASPLAGVLLLAVLDVVVADVLNQSVHVTKIASLTAIPGADSDLLLKLLLVEFGVDRRVGDVARGV